MEQKEVHVVPNWAALGRRPWQPKAGGGGGACCWQDQVPAGPGHLASGLQACWIQDPVRSQSCNFGIYS